MLTNSTSTRIVTIKKNLNHAFNMFLIKFVTSIQEKEDDNFFYFFFLIGRKTVMIYYHWENKI